MDPVPRPNKKSEYSIIFASSKAAKGWRDLRATELTHLVDAWDYLTKTPQLESPHNSPPRGRLAFVERNGVSHQQWQFKLNERSGSRIWFYIEGQTVNLVQVFTAHPNETK
jgi:hypothetical protein